LSGVFLDALDTKPTFSPAAIHVLGKTYKFDSSDNAEIRNRFYRIALRSGPEYAKAAASEFPSLIHPSFWSIPRARGHTDAIDWVTDKGRMKFCRPTYRGIFAQDPQLAIRTFTANFEFYVSPHYSKCEVRVLMTQHPIARKMIGTDLGIVKTGDEWTAILQERAEAQEKADVES
jgi:leukotriene-A4 hydrolase